MYLSQVETKYAAFSLSVLFYYAWNRRHQLQFNFTDKNNDVN